MTMKKQWQQKRQTCRGSSLPWLQLRTLAHSQINTLSIRRQHLQESSSVSLLRPCGPEACSLLPCRHQFLIQTVPDDLYMCASLHSNQVPPSS